ncbi:ComEC family competence protein [Clostridium sp. AF12-19]|nr:ComEC family competence protein [Clostridium sp. AF12-28]RHS27369.1 ComEC family competence protein [Clostridium sp. AF12-19]
MSEITIISQEEKTIKRPLLCVTGGLVLGEALNLFIPAEQMMFGLAVWLLFFVCVFAHRKSRYVLPVFLFVAGMFAGVFRMGAEQTVFSREEEFFREEYEDGVVLQGTVQSVKEKDGTLEVVLKNCETEDADGETLRSVLCYLNEDSEFPAVGEKIRVFGEGKTADPARNPGVFDHQLYCRAKGISGIIYADGYTGMGGKAHIVSDSLYRIRRQLSGRLKLIALPEDAGILSAVLLGEKEDLDSAVYELYRKNGISHLLAISGLHVSIVGLGIWKLFRKGGAGFWISGIFAGGFLIAYGMMVGSGASVVRAVSMAGLSFLAAAVGRTYDLPTAMCIPALGLLLTRPYLLTQASFQLSFLAVISLVYPGRLFSVRGETFFTNEKFSAAASAFFVSLSLQMVTAPVVCWHSFGIPVYGVFLNLLVIPLMTYVVLSGFLGLGLSFISASAGGAMLGGAHYILKLYEVVCNGIGKLPGAELVLGQPEMWKIGCYYGLVVSGAIIYERGMKIAEKFHEKKHKSKEKSEESVLNLWKTRILIDRKHRLVFLCAAWLLAFFSCFHPAQRASLSLSSM